MSHTLVLRLLVFVSLFTGAGCTIDLGHARADRLSSTALNQDLFGLWVTRWDFQTPEDVRTIVADARASGVTDIFWQVRGQGDAYYDSPYEPWGEDLTLRRDKNNKPIQDRSRPLNPGFDPLRLAISESHANGIRVHAWVNAMPLWKGTDEPIDVRHPLLAHPEWRLRDETGTAQPLSDGYVVVNPVLDEVQDHIVRIVGDIADRYDIDGLHLDYIRFLSDELGTEKLYPGDARSLSLYNRQVGDRATIGQLNRSRYREWIRDRISTLVARIGEESLEGHDDVVYSAAVWRRPDLAKNRYLQDAERWVNEGTVDLIMPMIYTEDDSQFTSDLQAWYSVVDRRRVVPGIGAYKHKGANQTITQASLGHPRRFVLFAYSTIFESVNPGQERSDAGAKEREQKRAALSQFIDRVGS
ncbi:MAG: family 10 glycosylhydrolase [Phycisphaerales bacterium]|nr:family 10 glycosylhydrolase [Phycisphaerales bacterium]